MNKAVARTRRRTEPKAVEAKNDGVARSRVEYLMTVIGERIVGNVYQPQNTLPTEQELCDELKVGRNAVREAVKMLAGKGFLRTDRRAGTTILASSEWRMLDSEVLSWVLRHPAARDELLGNLTQLRRIIEPEVAALAAEHATTTETLRIFEAFENMERHARDRARAIEADVYFHRQLFAAAHNPLIASLSQSFAVLLRANFEISIERKDGYIRNLNAHKLIAEAIHKRDPEAARAEMLKLLTNNDDDLRAIMGKSQSSKRKK